jgi:hypothetical protein
MLRSFRELYLDKIYEHLILYLGLAQIWLEVELQVKINWS